MSNGKEIEKLYQTYLKSALAPEAGRELSQALQRVGLQNESRALEFYFQHISNRMIASIRGQDWNGRRCFVGPQLPKQVSRGDVWFDIVELTPMVLVPTSQNMAADLDNWVSMHPAYVWQFRTFLELADVQPAKKYFMNVSDLMAPDRFASMNSMDFVTNVYHEEAVAYAHWFGKYLCNQFVLQAAQKLLKPGEFAQLIPSTMRLWDETQYPLSEFVRIAVGRAALNKDPDEEFELREAKANASLPDRMLYEEWDRTPEIGILTMVNVRVGLLQSVPRIAYEFIELKNAAPRP